MLYFQNNKNKKIKTILVFQTTKTKAMLFYFQITKTKAMPFIFQIAFDQLAQTIPAGKTAVASFQTRCNILEKIFVSQWPY